MNKGIVFVTVFRWLLVLLTALVFEKLADGLCVSLTGESFFTHVSLWIDMGEYGIETTQFVKPSLVPSLQRNWQTYVTGIAQIVVTLLFLARYFLCLIDGIERKVRITVLTDFSKPDWQILLSRLSTRTIVGSAIISVLEFILLYHAVISIPSIAQWLFFLLLLVAVDTIWFFIPKLAKSGIIAAGVLIAVIPFTLALYLISWLMNLICSIFKKQWKGLDNFDSKLKPWTTKFTSPLRKEWSQLVMIFCDYYWNFIDLAAIFGCLYCISNPSILSNLPVIGGLPKELSAAIVFTAVVIVISIANFLQNKNLYRVHINTLSIRQAVHVAKT